MMDRTKQLENEKIITLLVRFSVPAIVGMLVNAFYNVVDRIFIGNAVGPLGIAGITVSFPLMVIIMAFGMLVGFGSTSLLSIRLGEKKNEEAERILANGMTLLISGAITLTVLGLLFLEPLLSLFGAGSDVLPYSVSYMRIILIGTIFQAIGFGMNNYIRALGNPKTAMMTMLIGAVINIILDPIFIFVFDWGIQGAALATVISQFISSAWVLYYFFGGASHLKIRAKNIPLNARIVKRSLALGFPPFIMQIASSFLLTIMNRSLKFYGGDIAIAAVGIVLSINMLILMPVIGIKQGVQPIIGYNYGARKYKRVKKTVRMGLVGSFAITLTGFLACMIFPEQIVSLFGREDPAQVEIGARALRIFMSFLPLAGIQIIGAAYFQAVGKPRPATLLSLSRQVLILIPALLILPLYFGLDGIFASIPLADLLAAFLALGLLFFEFKKLGIQEPSEFVSEPKPGKVAMDHNPDVLNTP